MKEKFVRFLDTASFIVYIRCIIISILDPKLSGTKMKNIFLTGTVTEPKLHMFPWDAAGLERQYN